MSDTKNKQDKTTIGKESVEITRKEAIRKVSKYAAATAVATFIILNPKQSQATSPPSPSW